VRKYLLEIGAPSLLIGVGLSLSGMLNFWAGVACLYLGAALLFIFLLTAKKLHWTAKAITGVAYCLFVVWFSLAYVFISCPLPSEIHYRPDPYPDGALVDGLKWGSDGVDTRISLSNPTKRDYEDVDLEISVDVDIVGAAQVTSIPGVDIFPQTDSSDSYLASKDSNGPAVILPNAKEWVRTSVYRLRCGKFPKRSTMQVTVETEKASPWIDGKAPQRFFGPRTIPKWVSIKGTFKGYGRDHEIAVVKDFAQ
jgi:hypothetical protein